MYNAKVWAHRGASGYVKDLSLEELKSLNVNKTHPEYVNAKIPTLKEVYEVLKPYGITINVELKTGIFWYPGLEEKVVKLTEEMGMCEHVIYSSFNHASIVKIRECAPHAQTAILYSDVIVDTVGYAEKLGVNALHPAVYHLKMADFMKEWVNSSLDVNVWTVNEKEDMEMFMKAGVHAVITNYPDLAAAVREKGFSFSE